MESRDSYIAIFILRKIDLLYLPKFLVSTDYSLEDVLPELGIREVFSKQADLSKITEAKDLSVSQVRQKTQGTLPWVLNVDGEGHVGMQGWYMCENSYISEVL